VAGKQLAGGYACQPCAAPGQRSLSWLLTRVLPPSVTYGFVCVCAHRQGLSAAAGVRGWVGALCPWCSDHSGCECASECTHTSKDGAGWGPGLVQWLRVGGCGVSEVGA